MFRPRISILYQFLNAENCFIPSLNHSHSLTALHSPGPRQRTRTALFLQSPCASAYDHNGPGFRTVISSSLLGSITSEHHCNRGWGLTRKLNLGTPALSKFIPIPSYCDSGSLAGWHTICRPTPSRELVHCPALQRRSPAQSAACSGTGSRLRHGRQQIRGCIFSHFVQLFGYKCKGDILMGTLRHLSL